LIEPQVSLTVSELESTPPSNSNRFTVYSNTDLIYSATVTDGSSQINDKSTVNWDFGEGSKKSGLSVSHNYKNLGEYTLKLDVSVKDSGNTFTTAATYIVKVVKRPESKPPEITPTPGSNQSGELEPEISIYISNFEPLKKYGNKTAQVNLKEKLSFTSFVSGSYAKKANITKVKWDFGDKTKKTGITTSHKYTKAGKYTIQVTATTKYNGKTYTSTNVYNVYVVKKVDFSIESVIKNTDKKKNVVSLTVVVKNRGALASKATEIKVWYSSSALKKYSKVAKVKSLKAGKTVKLSIAFKIPYKYRKYTKKIKIDPKNKIAETVESNNQRNI